MIEVFFRNDIFVDGKHSLSTNKWKLNANEKNWVSEDGHTVTMEDFFQRYSHSDFIELIKSTLEDLNE